MRPQPKPTRIKLKGKALEALRVKLYESQGGRCKCGKPIPLHGELWGSHIHHKKRKGSGGHDNIENTTLRCAYCHDAIHRGLIDDDEPNNKNCMFCEDPECKNAECEDDY